MKVFSSINVIPIACGITAITALVIGCTPGPTGQPNKPSPYGTNFKVKAERFDACMKMVPTSRSSVQSVSNASLNAVTIPHEQTAEIISKCNAVADAQATCSTSSNAPDCIPQMYTY